HDVRFRFFVVFAFFFTRSGSFLPPVSRFHSSNVWAEILPCTSNSANLRRCAWLLNGIGSSRSQAGFRTSLAPRSVIGVGPSAGPPPAIDKLTAVTPNLIADAGSVTLHGALRATLQLESAAPLIETSIRSVAATTSMAIS